MTAVVRVWVSAYCWIAVSVVTVACFLAAWLWSPLVGLRRAFHLWLHRWAKAVLAVTFSPLEVRGLERIERGSIVVANHSSAADIVALAAAIPPPLYFVSRAEIVGIPFVGSVLRLGGHVLVRRSAAGAREPANAVALARAAERCRAGGCVVFFPEGTRSRDGKIGKFRGGAFRVAAAAERSVVPVAVVGTRSGMAPGSLLLVPSRVLVEVLRPVEPGDAAIGSETIRERVRRSIESVVDVAGADSERARVEEGAR